MDVRRALDKAGQAGVCKKGWVECGRGQLEIRYRKSFVYFDEEEEKIESLRICQSTNIWGREDREEGSGW